MLRYVGGLGYSWSSTVNSTNGVYLRFVMNAVQPNYASYRAYGFPLRCLSE